VRIRSIRNQKAVETSNVESRDVTMHTSNCESKSELKRPKVKVTGNENVKVVFVHIFVPFLDAGLTKMQDISHLFLQLAFKYRQNRPNIQRTVKQVHEYLRLAVVQSSQPEYLIRVMTAT